MPTELEQAFQCIQDERYEEAIQLINGLSKTDLENDHVTKRLHLFDYAVMKGRLDVANAIVEKYATSANIALNPLPIDYEKNHDNTQIYRLNNAPFMSNDYFPQYEALVDEQKNLFLEQIEGKSKELRIMGMEKLLELTTNPAAHAKLEKALSSYKENSLQINNLEIAFIEAEKSLGSEEKQTTRYMKMEACVSTSKRIDEQCTKFRSQNHYSHTPLDSFKNSVHDILNDPSNNILKHSSGPREYIASIGNFLMRNSGIGFVVAMTQGKVEDYKKRTWDVFNEKTASETQIDKIEAQASSIGPR